MEPKIILSLLLILKNIYWSSQSKIWIELKIIFVLIDFSNLLYEMAPHYGSNSEHGTIYKKKLSCKIFWQSGKRKYYFRTFYAAYRINIIYYKFHLFLIFLIITQNLLKLVNWIIVACSEYIIFQCLCNLNIFYHLLLPFNFPN